MKLIEAVYRDHLHNFFHIPAATLKHDMSWFEKFGIECKLIGRGGSWLGRFLVPGGQVVMKARGHKLDSEPPDHWFSSSTTNERVADQLIKV